MPKPEDARPASLKLEIRNFLGSNDDTPPTAKEIDESGTARMGDLVSIDPGELPVLVPRPSWGLIEEPLSAKTVFPRRFA